MCGIVGAVAKRDVVTVLMDGLRRLEYRGYDSAGIAVLAEEPDAKSDATSHLKIQRLRVEGKVQALQDLLNKTPMQGFSGVAHTRWATHGIPSERNAHPHVVGNRVILVHNGIIENYESLRERLNQKGKELLSDTDSEIVAFHIYEKLKAGTPLLEAVRSTIDEIEGAYALCVMDTHEPDRVVGVRNGPPLVLGLGENENFLASDVLALSRVADQFIYLEEGDIAEISQKHFQIIDKTGNEVDRKIYNRTFSHDAVDKGGYRHFMLKEIFEQPTAIRDTMTGRISKNQVLEQAFGTNAAAIFEKTRRVQIIACGTSFHAGLIGRLWIENMVGIPCQVEIASEFRYRNRAVEADTLLVCISQSGETADTLAALRGIKKDEFCGSLCICNVPNSSLVRESELVFMTQAGPEIGVCSTKAFSTQLVALFMLSLVLMHRHGRDKKRYDEYLAQLKQLPSVISETLKIKDSIQVMAKSFAQKSHALFLGRGLQYPVALEGALKLKEISYIHAEAYPAGELKHGPLALVDHDMPVIATVPQDGLLEKLKSNLQEVRTRGGELFVFADENSGIAETDRVHVLKIPSVSELLAPIVYTIPLQLLAYYVAVLKGSDVDQPRNLAKSVTVE